MNSNNKRRALILSSSKCLGELLELQVAEVGYTAQHFNQGSLEIKILEQGTHDILLLDMSLVSSNLINFMEEIRGSSIKSKVILLLACQEEQKLLNRLGLGHLYYLMKPFKYKDLEEQLSDVLRN